MNTSRHILTATICAGLLLSVEARGDAPPKGEKTLTEVESVGTDTPGVTKGFKAILEGFNFEEGASLDVTINPILLFSSSPKTPREYREAYANDWFNPRGIEVSVSVAPLLFEDEVAPQVGDWSIGARWNIYDTTQPLRPEAVERLELRGIALSMRQYTVDGRAQVATWVREIIDMETRTSTTQLRLRQTWPVGTPAIRAHAGALAATPPCAAKSDPRALADILAALVWSAIDPRKNEVGVVIGTFDATLSELMVLSPEAQKKAAFFQSEWVKLAEKSMTDQHSQTNQQLIDSLAQEIRNGFILGVDASLSETATGTKTTGSDDVEALRDYAFKARVTGAWRHYRPSYSIDLALDAVKFSAGENRRIDHRFSATLEVLRGQLNGSSLIVQASVDLTSYNDDDSDDSFPLSFKESLSIPIKDKISVAVSVEHVDEGEGFEHRPSLSLSWAFDEDGRTVDFRH